MGVSTQCCADAASDNQNNCPTAAVADSPSTRRPFEDGDTVVMINDIGPPPPNRPETAMFVA
jgi:hypothetical protein